MSKYNVGDKVRVKDYVSFGGRMIEEMLPQFGGTIRTISKVIGEDDGFGGRYNIYNFEGDPLEYEFGDEDIEGLVKPPHKTQRIEIPIPGGHLVAETCDWGGTYPGIFVSFVKSGETEDRILCFAEVDIENNPDAIRLGTFYEDGSDVKEIFEYPMKEDRDE